MRAGGDGVAPGEVRDRLPVFFWVHADGFWDHRGEEGRVGCYAHACQVQRGHASPLVLKGRCGATAARSVYGKSAWEAKKWRRGGEARKEIGGKVMRRRHRWGKSDVRRGGGPSRRRCWRRMSVVRERKKAREPPVGANQERRRVAWQQDGAHGRSVNLGRGAPRLAGSERRMQAVARETELRKGLGASRPGQEPVQNAWRGGGSVLERIQAILPPETRSPRRRKLGASDRTDGGGRGESISTSPCAGASGGGCVKGFLHEIGGNVESNTGEMNGRQRKQPAQ